MAGCGSCGGGGGGQMVRWRHTMPAGQVYPEGGTAPAGDSTTLKKQKYEVDWLLRKYGGTIEREMVTP